MNEISNGVKFGFYKIGCYCLTYLNKMAQVIYKYVNKGNFYIHLSIFEKDINAPTLIFVHGSGCHFLVYYDFLSALRDEGFNVIGIDLPGHGKSSGKRGKFTYREIMESISLTIDYAVESYNNKIGIIGSSLGGFLSLYACGEDSRIKSAVCHNVIDLCNLPSNKKLFSSKIFRIPSRIISYLLPNVYVPLSYLFSWEDVFEDRRYLEKLKNDELMVWKWTLSSIASLFIFNKNKLLIPSIRTKIFILVSEKDKILTENYCKSVFNKVASSEKKFLSVPDCGHMLFVEHIPKVIGPISEWFCQTLT